MEKYVADFFQDPFFVVNPDADSTAQEVAGSTTNRGVWRIITAKYRRSVSITCRPLDTSSGAHFG